MLDGENHSNARAVVICVQRGPVKDSTLFTGRPGRGGCSGKDRPMRHCLKTVSESLGGGAPIRRSSDPWRGARSHFEGSLPLCGGLCVMFRLHEKIGRC